MTRRAMNDFLQTILAFPTVVDSVLLGVIESQGARGQVRRR